MNSAIPSSCMDRYINRYIGPPHPVQQPQQQQHPHQQQLLSQNGFYPHQQLLQQQQQQQQQQHQQQVVQQQHQQLSQGHGPPPHNFMVGCYSNASGWTGVPLISTAARRPRKFPPVINGGGQQNGHYQPNSKLDFDENAMSRLALHAHGAPLILANNRYNRSNSKPGPNKPNKVPSNHAPSRDDHLQHHLKMVQAMGQQQQQQQHQQLSHPNDAHSVASDESGPNSGTTNSSASSSSSSDTCLPRIIKPRKRRKKDRKPAQQTGSTPSSEPTQTSTTSSTPQHSAVNQLLLDETTRDFLHEIALMANAGTFDFSGLIREQQQQQHQQPVQVQQPPQQQHFSSSNSDSSDSGINNLACSCRLCDPFCKIWAFPLRRSCSDNSAEIELNRAKDVGVIGSNRSNSFRSEWRSSPHSLEQQQQQDLGGSGSRKGSFSDSGDSGCDLLSGLTFCSEDILSSVNRELFLTPVDGGKEFKYPMTGGGGGGGPNSISGSGSPSSSVTADGASEMLLISELTKKLNEGLDLRSSGGGSSDSGSSVFSDSVFGEGSSPPGTANGGSADLFVNFDAISRNNLFSVNNISKLSNLLFDDGLTAPGLVINSGQHLNHNNNVLVGGANGTAAATGVNYIRNKNVQNPPPPTSSAPVTTTTQQRPLFSEHQPFVFVPDADQQQQQLNCFDMVWSNDRKLLPVEE
ncbi:homeotic protein female sterile [Culex pipiens pallens]|uniref:homeotic protein female sterile n=1 Tax=Culex pipiens pallens TaxID=42434 RepID=UPI001953F64E|nr:homeotic protein female sterile [Culex pipiens pallens]